MHWLLLKQKIIKEGGIPYLPNTVSAQLLFEHQGITSINLASLFIVETQ